MVEILNHWTLREVIQPILDMNVFVVALLYLIVSFITSVIMNVIWPKK